jgi:hypothetical protein
MLKNFPLLVFMMFGDWPNEANCQCTEPGREVQVSGFVMDNFCIDRGTLLDKPRLRTLEYPEEHTIHCLIDIQQCVLSSYALLEEKAPGSGGEKYKVAYQLGSGATQIVIAEAEKLRKQGVKQGVRMTFKGVDDSGTLKCVSIVAANGTDGSESKHSIVDVQLLRSIHGSLMFIAWLVFAPAGILIARYSKETLVHSWFRIHFTLLLFSSLFTVIATFVIFYSTWPSTTFDNKADSLSVTHAAFGIIVIVIGGFLQPALGKYSDFKYSPGRHKTPVFPDKVHWWVGRSLYMLAFGTIWMGVKVFGVGVYGWVIAGTLCTAACLVAVIAFEHLRRKASSEDENAIELL